MKLNYLSYYMKIFLEKWNFIIRISSIIYTWGFIVFIKFIPYEIYYGIKFNSKTLFSLSSNELDVSKIEKEHSTEYIPTPFYIAHKIFFRLQNKLIDSEFVDFGCGAGRIMMFVSHFKPKKIIGIEFSKKLCECAISNLNLHFSKYPHFECEWYVEHCNAINYQIGNNENIFFLYDPFNANTLELIVNNIMISLNILPREIFIIYVSPIHKNVLIEKGFSTIISEINQHNKGFIILTNNK